jgi:acid phosphatase type 7
VSGDTFGYRILKDKKVVFAATAQAPRSSNQPFRIVAFGDTRVGSIEQEALAGRVMQSKPRLVVVTGDIAYKDGLTSDYREKGWPVYNADKADANGAPIMRSIPWVATVGNHDTDSRDLDEAPDALAYYLYLEQSLNGPVGREGGAFVPTLKGSDTNKQAF